MNISYWISKRLQLRGGSGSGSSAAVVIAVVGIAIALVVLELTIAIVVGFKNEIKYKLSGFDAQLTVAPPYDHITGEQEPFLKLNPVLDSIIDATLPNVHKRVAIRQPGIIKTDDNFQGIIFVAISSVGENKDDFTFERENIVEGVWPDFEADSTENMIVVSRPTARQLGLELGDKVYSTFIVDDNVKMRRHKIVGLFESNFGEYDNSIVYMSRVGLGKIVGAGSEAVSRIELRGVDNDEVETLSSDLQTALVDAMAQGRLNQIYPVGNIKETGVLYFNWLSLLDTNVIVIFVLMLCIAGFTLVSCLFILILERVRTIGVLMAMGATKSQIRNIFVFMSMKLVAIGLLIGNIVGLGVLLLQKYCRIMPLDPEMYYLRWVPVDINIPAIILLNIGVISVAWLVLVVPSQFASSVDPTKTMNFE